MTMSTATLYAQLDALADDWLASSSRASATQRAYRVEVSRMLTWAGSQRHISLTNLPDDYLCQFLECIASQQPACYLSAGIRKQLRPSSVLQSKRILTAMFLWGAEQDRVPSTDTATPANTRLNLWWSWNASLAGAQALWFLRLDNVTDELAYNASSIGTLRALAPLPGRGLTGGVRVRF